MTDRDEYGRRVTVVTDFSPGWAGCTKPGHPNFHSHDCAATEAAIQTLPPELRPVMVSVPEDKAPTYGLDTWGF